MPKDYVIIEHTADIGIKVEGADLKELFRKACLAMFDIMAEKIKHAPAGGRKLTVKLSAANIEELFINWLNELLSLSGAKGLIFTRIDIGELSDNKLVATVRGFPAKAFRLNTEIKAATYHELKLSRRGSGWQAQVIFDV